MRTSKTSTSVCECCGTVLGEHTQYRGEDTLARRGGYRSTIGRINRVTLPTYHISAWDARLQTAGILHWAGRKACPDCARRYTATASGD